MVRGTVFIADVRERVARGFWKSRKQRAVYTNVTFTKLSSLFKILQAGSHLCKLTPFFEVSANSTQESQLYPHPVILAHLVPWSESITGKPQRQPGLCQPGLRC